MIVNGNLTKMSNNDYKLQTKGIVGQRLKMCVKR